MPTTLADPTPFPIRSDGDEPERLARAWATDVMQFESGAEIRAALRSVPVRRYEFTAKFASAEDMLRFRALWLAAVQPLRFDVGIWQREADVTAFTSSTRIAGDFTHATTRGFVAGAKRAMLHQSETQYELVDVESVSDTEVVLSNPIVGTYTIGAVSLAPVMTTWLDPPTVEQRGVTAEQVALVFREELPGVSGTDASIGGAATPVPASIDVRTADYGSPWPGRKFITISAIVKDAAGMPIPNAPVTWELVPVTFGLSTPLLEPPTIITYPRDGQEVEIQYEGGASTLGSMTGSVIGAGAVVLSESVSIS